MRVWLENAYSRPLIRESLLSKNEEKLKRFAVLFIQKCNNRGLASNQSTSAKVSSVA